MVPLAAALLAAFFLLHCALLGRAALMCLPGAGGGAGFSLEAFLGRPLAAFFGICLGMLVNMGALFALGMLGFFHLTAVAWTALALVAGALALRWGRTQQGGHSAQNASTAPGRLLPGRLPTDVSFRRATLSLELLTLAALFLLCIAVSLHPPGHWDDTMYQLPLARHYVEQQAIVLDEYVRFPLFPQNFNLLFSLGMMVGDAVQRGAGAASAESLLWYFGAPEVFAQLFATLPLFIMALGVWGASHRYLGSGIPGLLAGLTLFMIGPVKSTLGFAYIDNGLAMFCMAAALAAACMAERGFGVPAEANLADAVGADSGSNADTADVAMANANADIAAVNANADTAGAYANADTAAVNAEANVDASARSSHLRVALILLAGLMAGGACGTKYFGVVMAVVVGIAIVAIVFICERRPAAKDMRPVSARQPFHRALQAAALYAAAVLMAGIAWYVRSALISGDPIHPAGARFFGFFLWNEGDLAFQHAEQAQYGVRRNPLLFPIALLEAGVLLWLPAFAGLFLRRVPAPIRVLQAVFLGYMLFWFFVTQVPRYLAPVYGLGGLLTFYALYRAWLWARRRPRLRNAAWAAVIMLVLTLTYTAERSIKYGREFAHPEPLLAAKPGYALYQQANAHIGEFGSRLVQVGFEGSAYFFQGTVIGDWFGPGRYRDTLACAALPCPLPPLETLNKTMEKHGARMLLLSRQHVAGLPGEPVSNESVTESVTESGPDHDLKELWSDSHFSGGWLLLRSDADGVLLGFAP